MRLHTSCPPSLFSLALSFLKAFYPKAKAYSSTSLGSRTWVGCRVSSRCSGEVPPLSTLLSPGRDPTSVGGPEHTLGSRRGYRMAVNGHAYSRRGNCWSRSSGARAFKEGHKLVIRTKEDGILFLGLLYFVRGGRGIRRSSR